MNRSPTAAAMGTLPRPSPRPRNWSRRSMRFRTWRTRRWSRSMRPPIGGGPHRRLDGHSSPRVGDRVRGQGGRRRSEGVFVHNCFLGGGFGRRAVNDELIQAVEVSKALGRPIKLIWTREEDIRSDRYRPQAALRMRAALARTARPPASNFRRRSARSCARSAGKASRTASSAWRSKASPIVLIAPTR